MTLRCGDGLSDAVREDAPAARPCGRWLEGFLPDSPDFMYVVHRNNGKKELNIVIETKGVDIEENLRGEETIKIKCAQEFFKQLQEDGFYVEFRTQINNDDMKKIVAELIK